MSLELRWSKEKPTKKGWYWIRKERGDSDPVIAFTTEDYFQEAMAFGWEFAGPIELPRDIPPDSELPTVGEIQDIYRQYP